MSSNTSLNRYGSIAAEIYDLDKPAGSMPDTAFHLQGLAHIKGPILEPACGSGRTLLPLLQAGHDVTGFDDSPEMLERCERLCAGHGFTPHLSRRRYEDFTYPNRFAAIIVPVGSFTLIDDYDVACSVLRRFHDHLEPGGLVALDIQPLSFLASTADDRRKWTAENGDLLTLVGKRFSTDWVKQRVEYHLRYERWRNNTLVEAQLEPMVQRYWGLPEFTLTLEAAGFTDVRVSSNYARGRPPSHGARTMTFEATRA